MSEKKEVRWVSRKYYNDNGEDTIDYMSIDKAIEFLQKAQKDMQDGKWKDLSIEIEDEYGSHHTILEGRRPETDKERIDREAEEKHMQECRRMQYKKLKEEFGE